MISAEAYNKINDTINEGTMFIRAAYGYRNKGDLDNALHYYKLSTDILSDTDASFWKGLANDHIGWIFLVREIISML